MYMCTLIQFNSCCNKRRNSLWSCEHDDSWIFLWGRSSYHQRAVFTNSACVLQELAIINGTKQTITCTAKDNVELFVISRSVSLSGSRLYIYGVDACLCSFGTVGLPWSVSQTSKAELPEYQAFCFLPVSTDNLSDSSYSRPYTLLVVILMTFPPLTFRTVGILKHWPIHLLQSQPESCMVVYFKWVTSSMCDNLSWFPGLH